MDRQVIEQEANEAQRADLKQCMDRAVAQLSADAVEGCKQIASVAKQCVADELRKLDQNDIGAPKTTSDITRQCRLDAHQR